MAEENRSVFALKSAPPPSPFACFLDGNQFAGKTGNSVKNKFRLFVEEFKKEKLSPIIFPSMKEYPRNTQLFNCSFCPLLNR